jgi:hypothetical protein
MKRFYQFILHIIFFVFITKKIKKKNIILIECYHLFFIIGIYIWYSVF